MENAINLQQICNEFIEKELDGDKSAVQSRNEFLIYYLSAKIKPQIDHKDIQQLTDLFNQYVYICGKYGIIPSARMFCILANINHQAFNNMVNGVNVSSECCEFAKYVNNICQSVVENRLTNSDKTNINLMFISKAVYGYTETMPVQRIEKIDISSSDLLSINDRYRNIKAIETNDT